MLTPIELQNHSFKSGGLGYDKKDVDQFMKEVLENYEALYREKMELEDKFNAMNNALQQYKTIEKTMHKALILAQKSADEIRLAARKNAQQIEKEAVTRAQIIISDANNSLKGIHQQTIRLAQQYETYKAQFKNLAAAQIELLEADSFRINLSDITQPVIQDTFMSTVTAQAEAAGAAEAEEPLPELDFSFVDAASDTENEP